MQEMSDYTEVTQDYPLDLLAKTQEKLDYPWEMLANNLDL